MRRSGGRCFVVQLFLSKLSLWFVKSLVLAVWKKKGSTETSSRTTGVRWNSKEPEEWRKAGCSPWRESGSLTTLVNAAVLVPKQILSLPAAERTSLSPCSLHGHRWAGARNEKADFCLELADTYHFASKRMTFWMLFPHVFWLAQLIFFLACNFNLQLGNNKTNPKTTKNKLPHSWALLLPSRLR